MSGKMIGPDHGDLDASFKSDGDRQYLLSIGRGSYILDYQMHIGSLRASILVGRYSSIGPGTVFEIGLNHDHHLVSTYNFKDYEASDEDSGHYYENNHYQIIIGNDVWIDIGVQILGGVRIGNGAVIGMGSMITKDVPPYSVVIGNPARIVEYRFDQDIIKKMGAIRWWNWEPDAIQAARDDMMDPEKFVDKYYKEISVPKNDFTGTMDRVKAAGGQMFYFALDYDSPRPLWDKVLASFAEAFSHDDNMTLFLEIPDSPELLMNADDLARLNTLLSQCLGIATVTAGSDNARAVFSHSTAVIVPSCVKALAQVDMAEFLGIEVRSACDWESGLFR